MTSTIDVPALNVRVMGVTIAIDPEDQATRDRLAHQWSRAVASDTDETTGRPGGGPGADQDDAGNHARRLRRDARQVTLAALIVTSGQRFNLHAGGLADEQGRVLALVGRSGTGKTTATRLLAERLDYLSDETVSITPDGLVHPHAEATVRDHRPGATHGQGAALARRPRPPAHPRHRTSGPFRGAAAAAYPTPVGWCSWSRWKA